MPKTFEYNFQKIGWLFTHLHEAKDASAALGMGSLAVLLGVKMIKRCYPATPERMQSKMFKLWYYLSSFTLLIVVVAAAGIAYTLEKRGVEVHILGDLAAGLGAPRAPELGKFEFKSMISPALQVSLLVRGIDWVTDWFERLIITLTHPRAHHPHTVLHRGLLHLPKVRRRV